MISRRFFGFRHLESIIRIHVDMSSAMEIETRLRNLESFYRHALSAAVAAKARYLALDGESSSTSAAIARAEAEWHMLESRRALFAAQMRELEGLEHESII